MRKLKGFLCFFSMAMLLISATLASALTVGPAPERNLFYRVQRDLRKCPSPLCGGYFITPLNKKATTYVSDVDWGGLGLSDAQLAELEAGTNDGGVVVLGRIVRPLPPIPAMPVDIKTQVLVLSAQAAWAAATDNKPSGINYRLEDTGIVCIKDPCFSLLAHQLNTSAKHKLSGLDLQGVGATQEQLDLALQALKGDNLLVVGKKKSVVIKPVYPPDPGKGKKPAIVPVARGVVLVASQFYLPVEAEGRCKVNEDCNDPAGVSSSSFCAKKTGDCGGIGVCTDKPTVCPDAVIPVCGCDGVTYGNECEANAVGVSVAHKGQCEPVVVACKDNAGCEPTQLCEKRPGICDTAEGACVEKPVGCPKNIAPVCGCDGNTYSNGCMALAAGVNVAHDGECAVVCKDNAGCGDKEYCAKKPGVCADGVGVCKAISGMMCPMYWSPVCGCDGVTYGNQCEAAAAGANILHDGECKLIDGACKDNSECRSGEYCVKKDGDCMGVGVCKLSDGMCPLAPNCDPSFPGCPPVIPVCGCDGKTYSDRCAASMAGVSVASIGECAQNTKCMDSTQCGSSQFCQKQMGNCVGAGVCTDKPAACIMIHNPVCGCDGQTYSNECIASAAGVCVAHKGMCMVCMPMMGIPCPVPGVPTPTL